MPGSPMLSSRISGYRGSRPPKSPGGRPRQHGNTEKSSCNQAPFSNTLILISEHCMGRVISVSNQKGGVGKTTTAVNLAAFIAERGKRVLIIDIDTQANAGYGLGINAESGHQTIYEVLIGSIPIREAIIRTAIEGLHILPSNIHLARAQVDLLDIEEREFILRNAVKDIREEFDYIFIDCPPSLGILTLNSLVAADS